MKKTVVLGLLLVFVPLSSQAQGQDEPWSGVYVGAGASYAVEDFDSGQDFDDSWGINVKAGYYFCPWFALELNVDHLIEFEFDGPGSGGDVDVTTAMLAGKFALETKPLKPFVALGFGYLDAESSLSGDLSEEDTCGKMGIGVDFFVSDNMSIGLEGDYVIGFGDVADVNYYNITLGIVFYL